MVIFCVFGKQAVCLNIVGLLRYHLFCSGYLDILVNVDLLRGDTT